MVRSGIHDHWQKSTVAFQRNSEVGRCIPCLLSVLWLLAFQQAFLANQCCQYFGVKSVVKDEVTSHGRGGQGAG